MFFLPCRYLAVVCRCGNGRFVVGGTVRKEQRAVRPQVAVGIVGSVAALAQLKVEAGQKSGVLKVLDSGVELKFRRDHRGDSFYLEGMDDLVETEIAAGIAALQASDSSPSGLTAN